MKKLLPVSPILTVAVLGAQAVCAQPVPKAVLVEHFTNTYCSVCANRNPGFYQNLAQFPQALYISYYPSSPYPACPLNQYNKPEADARTMYYGVYGSTPRLVIQGTALPANAAYGSPSLIQSELGKTASYTAALQLKPLSATTGEARFVVRKTDTSMLDSVSLYVAVVEDTLLFNAANGELSHYHVFRRSVWGQQPLRVRAPQAIGDSVVAVQSFPVDAAWTLSNMSGIGVVQQKEGVLIQAARSGPLSTSGTMTVQSMGALNEAGLYPNPVRDVLHVVHAVGAVAMVYTMQGQQVMVDTIGKASVLLVQQLPAGLYFLHLTDGPDRVVRRFVKQ